jgi:hypothetical protein
MLNERRANWRGWIEMLRITIDMIATDRVKVPQAPLALLIPNSVQTAVETGSAQANVVAAKMVETTPPSMNGLRRPHEIRDRSLMTPTTGWMAEPQIGATAQMRDDWVADMPREKR